MRHHVCSSSVESNVCVHARVRLSCKHAHVPTCARAHPPPHAHADRSTHTFTVFHGEPQKLFTKTYLQRHKAIHLKAPTSAAANEGSAFRTDVNFLETRKLCEEG